MSGSGESTTARKRVGTGGSSSQGGVHIRPTANSIDQHVLSLNERILHDVFNIYADKDVGLVKIGKMLDVEMPYPRRKVTILVMGNHSAGKSSFINWYIEESIMKTSVAIETQGFSFVTSGKKRDSLKGPATIQLYPHLRSLQEKPGVMDFLTTEVSTSRSKRFNLVTFVDTPGLVDGDMHYPFDVNDTLLWLGEMADLVFVFFDPMGQALCKRTLNILERMWASHSEKIRLYLAKADEAGSETDRQRVLMQIVQELCKRPGLNRTGFDMPTIYLPEMTSKPSKCANQIDELCSEVDKTIEQTVQNSLNNLEKDVKILHEKLKQRLALDAEARSRNFGKKVQGYAFGSLGLLLPLVFLGVLVVSNASVRAMRMHIGSGADVLHLLLNPLASLWSMVPADWHIHVVTGIIILSAVSLIVSRLSYFEVVLPSREVKSLKLALDVVQEVGERKKTMYTEYLRQSLTDADFYG